MKEGGRRKQWEANYVQSKIDSFQPTLVSSMSELLALVQGAEFAVVAQGAPVNTSYDEIWDGVAKLWNAQNADHTLHWCKFHSDAPASGSLDAHREYLKGLVEEMIGAPPGKRVGLPSERCETDVFNAVVPGCPPREKRFANLGGTEDVVPELVRRTIVEQTRADSDPLDWEFAVNAMVGVDDKLRTGPTGVCVDLCMCLN